MWRSSFIDYVEGEEAVPRKRRRIIPKHLRTFTGSFMAGMAFGFVKPIVDFSNEPVKKIHGLAAFPNEFPEDISAPFWPKTVKIIADCEKEPPKICNGPIDCQSKCGPNYDCQEVGEQMEFNGYLLEAGQRYCLPKVYANLGCKEGVSRMVISYDAILNKFIYKCKCLYPEIFSGYNCNEIVACRDPSDPSKRAPLIDRKTGQEVDLLDSAVVKKIDFHAVDYSEDGTAQPRYYCACKKINPLLTSAIQCLECMRDPCFPLLNAKPHETATGWADGSTGEMDCGCGFVTQTRLMGGGKNPCVPIMDPKCKDFVHDLGFNTIDCKCESNEIFLPCMNKYRKRANKDVGNCGEGNAAFMTRNDAPQAGQCINSCKYCQIIGRPTFHGKEWSTDPCQDDVRTQGRCQVASSEQWQRNIAFTCHCDLASWANWWKVDSTWTEEKCKGRKPECIYFLRGCTKSIHNSWEGPQCCRCMGCHPWFSHCAWIIGCFK